MKKLPGLLRTHHCGELNRDLIGKKVTICGWVNKYRDLGGLHFVDIRDKYGLTQLGFEEFKGDINILKTFPLESVIQAIGTVRQRPESAINKKMKTGEVEVQVEEVKLLSDCKDIPFLPHGLIEATEDLRLKYRYIDLRTDHLQNILKLRSDITRTFRETLYSYGFTEVETPILYKTTPEGARDYIVPSRVHKNKVYALPQSPQTLKQLLMIGSTDKYFQICRCFRDEDLRADRQPEFTQVDIEVSFPTQDYIKNLATELVKNVYKLPEDFMLQTMSYEEALSRYGSDKPDVRFGLEHLTVTSLFKDSAFSLFKTVADDNGLIKAIFVPESMGTLARKDIDGLTDVVKPFGGKGVAWFKVQDGAVSGGISKFVDDKLLNSLQDLSSNENGLYLFFASSRHQVTHDCADAVRRFLGGKFELYSKDQYAFLWVNDFPLFEYDEDDGRFYARHHPFTMPKVAEEAVFYADNKEDLKNLKAEAYDLVCNGYELGGGSLRIYNQKMQERMFDLLSMTKEEREHQFGFFIEALKYGTPPHAGMAFGLDRVVMLAAKTDSIRDVIAFPKTTSATDLMASAPSTPSEEQTKELHFSWRE